MNKKKLSVVMAGAMLASSVAPVLAAETTVTKSEVSAAELGLLIKDLEDKLNSAKFAEGTKADDDRNGALKGKSIYYITVDGKGTKYNLDNLNDLETAIKGLKVGSTVQIYTEGFTKETVDGVDKYYARTNELKYTEKDLKADGKVAKDFAAAQAKNGGLQHVLKTYTPADETKINGVVTLGTGADTTATTVEIAKDSAMLDFTRPLDVDGKLLDLASITGDTDAKIDAFDHFDTLKTNYQDIDYSLIQEITITSGGNDFNVSDLYDGLMLTEKGHDILLLAKEAIADSKTVTVKDLNDSGTETKNSVTLKADKDGNYKFEVSIQSTFTGAPNYVYTVTGKDKAEIERLAEWLLAGHAQVDLYAGANRYETAVEIAKGLCGYGNDVKNIVLVNGDSLVDGLAAAPLAHSKNATKTPILLTESNKLPKATRDYLYKVIGGTDIDSLKTVTVSIVGGETVVSKSVERELRNLGFKVERFGGENREETSLKVAEAIGTDDKAFVVGGEGEADAMSIAGYAASQDIPIIVSKKGGITENALDTLSEAEVTVLGGEKAVSSESYKAIKESSKAVRRIAGANRKATNAAIIKEFYTVGNTKKVLVAKDDVLVDALSASTLSAKEDAPIVLATSKLSDEQVNVVYLKGAAASASDDTVGVYQVGNGVAPSVIKTIAQRLKLSN